MILTTVQQDALGELINIGFGRAANALSVLVGQRVVLDVPEVRIYPLEEMSEALVYLSKRQLTTVHQVFKGQISGDIMLLMDDQSASVLVDLIEDSPVHPRPLTEADKESMAEIGNILLSAFSGSFGNLLNVHITFAVPFLRLESVQQMMKTLIIEERTLEYAMVVKIQFHLVKGDVSGYVVIIMGVQSLEALFEALKIAGYMSS